MLASALRRYRGDRPLHDLEKGLLHAFAGHIPGDRRIVRLARDLIDLVDIDNPALRAFDVIIGGLQQLQYNVLDILADIAGLCQRRRVGHRERYVDDPRQGLGEQRLARSGRANQQNVRFGEFDVVVFCAMREALVMVVYGDRKDTFGVVLADHVIVEHLANVARPGNPVARLDQSGFVLLTDDVHAELDAFIADEHGRAGDQLSDLVLALAAERAVKRVLRIATASLGHNRLTPRLVGAPPQEPLSTPGRQPLRRRSDPAIDGPTYRPSLKAPLTH